MTHTGVDVDVKVKEPPEHRHLDIRHPPPEQKDETLAHPPPETTRPTSSRCLIKNANVIDSAQ
jgi:hypothetical protein